MPIERKKAEKVGLRFAETMSGYLAEGVEDFEEGEKKGQEQGNSLLRPKRSKEGESHENILE